MGCGGVGWEGRSVPESVELKISTNTKADTNVIAKTNTRTITNPSANSSDNKRDARPTIAMIDDGRWTMDDR